MKLFALDPKFVATYAQRTPPFGFNGLGYLVYLRTYSRLKADGAQEQWFETVERVVNGTYRMQQRHIDAHKLGWRPRKAQLSAQDMYDRIWSLKFVPPGRGLWAMGSALTEERGLFAALNNCFDADTRFITNHGVVRFGDVVGETVKVLNGAGDWVYATVHCHGEQPLQRVTFKPYGRRSNVRHSVVVTPNHTWVTVSGERTTQLRVGDAVPANVSEWVSNEPATCEAYVHGLIFGDGTQHTYYPDRYMLRLCGAKASARNLQACRKHPGLVSETLVAGEPFFTFRSATGYKLLPCNYNAASIRAFIEGWCATDGYVKASGTVCVDTQQRSAADWLIEHAPYAGLVVSGMTVDTADTNYGPRSAPLNRVTVSSAQAAFTVESIEPLGTAEVYCVTEPITHTFTLAGGILTGNCAFVSTKDLAQDLVDPFTFLMDASMLGIGVGFDTKGAGTLQLHTPNQAEACEVHVADTREGWVDSVGQLLLSYFDASAPSVTFDYTAIRRAGEPIRGFGGVASGPAPLQELHDRIRGALEPCSGQPISVTNIVDLMNHIGKCVVAGNVRRTAEIAFGAPDSAEFMDLKDTTVNPHRADFGWTSNNSIFATLGMDYQDAAARVVQNGEPGFAWLDNMQQYSRMLHAPDAKDHRVLGGNPCLEQSLESYELCCLVETFPARAADFADYTKTLKAAYLYAKTVTLGNTPWERTNQVLLRNRRIGLSQSGVQQAVKRLGLDTYKGWCEQGYLKVRHYDDVYSEWLTIPRSIKVTSIKPSGSVSLLAGATPGMHWPESMHYIRRIRLSVYSELIAPLRAAGYHVEPCVGSEATTVVVEVPIALDAGLRAVHEVSMWEQLTMAAFLQRYWADNQVSCTVTFDPEREGPQLAHALNYFQYQLKGVSFLPRVVKGAYAQMPYEACTAAEYAARTAELKPLNLGETHELAEPERFCDGEACLVT